MRSRLLILSLILLTVLATVLVAAAKLTATPKYDRIQVGMTPDEVYTFLNRSGRVSEAWQGDVTFVVMDHQEGQILVRFRTVDLNDNPRVTSKNIVRRNPLDRLAWLVGWRKEPRFPVERLLSDPLITEPPSTPP